MDDVRAVLEAVGSERAALFGHSEGGNMCLLFAATYPQRTTALITLGCFAKRRDPDDDYPWAPTAESREQEALAIEQNWGHLRPEDVEYYAPSRVGDEQFIRSLERYLRRAASPGAAAAFVRMNSFVDVRDILPAIQVPTLVLHRTGDHDVNVAEGRYLAATNPGREVRRAGRRRPLDLGRRRRRARGRDRGVRDRDAARAGARPRPRDGSLHRHRRLDAAGRGARRSPLARAPRRARRRSPTRARAVSRPRGRHCRRRLPRHLRRSGARRPLCALDRRWRSGNSASTSVRASTQASASSTARRCVGSRCTPARASQRSPVRAKCSISQTVKDLTAGSGLEFADRGVHELKGIPGEWRLYAAV